MENKYVIGFWNYNRVGYVAPERAVSDWAELGLNLGTSSVYSPEKPQDFEAYQKEFDEAEKRGMQLLACDTRTLWKTLARAGEAAFRKGLEDLRKEYGTRKGVFAFFLGDEPQKEDFDDVIKAAQIVKEIIPEKHPFLNLLPCFESVLPNVGAKSREEYGERISKIMRETEIPVLCYDCYTQCHEDRSQIGIDHYFENLVFYKNLAEKSGKPFWTSLLSVGHWSYRVPDEDDFRWQLSTAAAFGCKGVLWYKFYTNDGRSYRGSPFYGAEAWERSETFSRLSRQNRIFQKRYGDLFASSRLKKVTACKGICADVPAFRPDEYVASAEASARGCEIPLLLSEFERADGRIAVVAVNCSQQRAAHVKVTLQEGYTCEFPDGVWLAPGDLVWMDLEKR